MRHDSYLVFFKDACGKDLACCHMDADGPDDAEQQAVFRLSFLADAGVEEATRVQEKYTQCEVKEVK